MLPMMKPLVATILLLSTSCLADSTVTVFVTKTRYAAQSLSSTTSFSGSSSSSSSNSISVGTLNLNPYSQNSTTTTSSQDFLETDAAQTTVSLFNACNGPSDRCNQIGVTYYGGVVSADPTATVYAVDCVASLNATVCGTSAVTVTQGPSEYVRLQSQTDDNSAVYLTCDIMGSTSSAVCQQGYTVVNDAATATGVSAFAANSANGTALAVTMTFGSADIHYNPLVITSGAEKLASSTRIPKQPTSVTNIGTTPTRKPNAASSIRTHVGASLAGVLAVSFAIAML